MTALQRATVWLTAAALGASSCACADLPAQRAKRDMEVGFAQAGGVGFVVQDGLAAVRDAEPGRIVLWASAPELDIAAQSSAGATSGWSIEIQNAMPGAHLDVVTGPGVVDTRAPLASDLPTQLDCHVTLADASETVLRLLPPDPAPDAKLVRFAVLGDVQTGVDRVGDMLACINAEPGVEFVLGMGDATENGTVEQMDRFQHELLALRVPFFSAIGNHDAPADTPWQDFFGRGSESFLYRDVQFTLIDSAGSTVASQAYDWLDNWLAAGCGRAHVVVMHVPPMNPYPMRSGEFASHEEAGQMLSKLASGGVDLTLYGHIHSYYTFANAGIPAFISGGGGAHDQSQSDTQRHYMIIDMNPRGGLVATRMVPVAW